MRIYWLLCCIILANCNSKPASEQAVFIAHPVERPDQSTLMPDSVTDYINAALDSMQRVSIRKLNVDWPQLRKSTFNKAKGATTYRQIYPAIQEAIKALGDNHSFFITPEQHKQWLGNGNKSANKIDIPEGMMLDGKFALIRVYTFNSGDPERMQTYASGLQAKIKELDAQNPVGWIIDLSYNSGGNMWPMLAGLGPLIGEGVLGSFLAANGIRTTWMYKKGEVLAGNEVVLTIINPYKVTNPQAPVAILTSERTASSGEAILVSFIGRPNIRIIGTPTAGLSSANQNYSLVDGAQLILTTAVFSDRRGKLYGKQILPDVDLSDKWYFINGFHLHIMQREAKNWILKINQTRQ